MSFGKAELDLSREGVFVITGKVIGQVGFDDNGAGKSSIFEALCWSLFGQTIRKIGSKNSVVRRESEDGRNCHVSTNHNREIWVKHFQELLKKLYDYNYSQDHKIIFEIT